MRKLPYGLFKTLLVSSWFQYLVFGSSSIQHFVTYDETGYGLETATLKGPYYVLGDFPFPRVCYKVCMHVNGL